LLNAQKSQRRAKEYTQLTNEELTQIKGTLIAEIKAKTEATDQGCRDFMINLLEINDPNKYRAKMAGYE
jgi:hypothetical protein